MDQSYLTELDTEYRETSSKVSRLISRLKTAPDAELRGLIDEIKNELQNCSTSVHTIHSVFCIDPTNNIPSIYSNHIIYELMSSSKR